MYRKLPKINKGFTLIEILVTSVITVILAGGILALQYFIGQNQVTAWKNYLAVNDSNSSLNSIVRELRTAQNGENGAYPLERADANEIIFYSDVDFDSVIEKVRYFRSGTTFSRGVIEPVGFPVTYPPGNESVKAISEIIRNGAVPAFSYYNSDWPTDTTNNPIATPVSPVNVKLIKIYLRLNSDANDPSQDYILENFTQIRTLKSNI